MDLNKFASEIRLGYLLAGTPIQTPDGPRLIESLAVGDQVISYDVKTRALTPRPIVAILRSRVNSIRRVAYSEGHMRGITEFQRIYLPERDVYPAIEYINRGEEILFWRASGPERARILEVMRGDAPVPHMEVFNLTIDGPEANFFADGVLVHDERS